MAEPSKSPAVQGGPEHIQTAWKVLAGGAPVAASALVDIAENGKSEVARVQAATAILDRVGLAPPKEVHFRVVPQEAEDYGLTTQLSPAEVIRKRLKDLKGPTQALMSSAEQTGAMADALGLLDDDEGEIVEAELMPMSEGEGHPGAPSDPEDWGNPWA
ncbi:hypothetical protein [Longimicrobium sp.]|jgi:hypothetical protein|uniref:hypothetical protein n=1 Tax=Longimicrobium sp. TaxID=2029185 RepID=UPI002ED8033F